MKKLVLESYGKINLGLDVLYKRSDNYHEISTVMQQISLKDIIEIEESDKNEISIESNNKDMPLGSDNLVYKVWESLKEISGIKKGIHIRIHKNIPLAAGLAGGSSNGARVLVALNKLWKLGYSEEKLREIGKDLGADIPYCIRGGTVLAQGIGEKLSPLKSFAGKDILLINPGIGISTEVIYGKLDLKNRKPINMEKIIRAIEDDDIKALGHSMENIMEEVAIRENPIIGEMKKDIIKYGGLGALMSGSGPTVFGLFEDEEKLEYCEEKLREKYKKALIIKSKTI